MSKWFLLGAVVGFVILLFKFENFFTGQGIAMTGGAQAPTPSSACGCGCGATTPLPAFASSPSNTPPASANPGGGGFQYNQPIHTAPYSIGPIAPYNPPTFPVSATSGSGGSSPQYLNAAQPLPGATRQVY